MKNIICMCTLAGIHVFDDVTDPIYRELTHLDELPWSVIKGHLEIAFKIRKRSFMSCGECKRERTNVHTGRHTHIFPTVKSHVCKLIVFQPYRYAVVTTDCYHGTGHIAIEIKRELI